MLDFICKLFECLWSLIKPHDDEKIINNEYLEQIKDPELEFSWSDADKINSRLKQGYKIYYEYEFVNFKRTRYRLINKSKQVVFIKPIK